MTNPGDRSSTPADAARGAAPRLFGEAREEGRAPVVELHQIGGKAGEQVEEAEVTVKRTLKLVD